MKKLLILALSTVLFVNALPANAAIKAGSSCSAVGAKKISGDKEFTCIKSGCFPGLSQRAIVELYYLLISAAIFANDLRWISVTPNSPKALVCAAVI